MFRESGISQLPTNPLPAPVTLQTEAAALGVDEILLRLGIALFLVLANGFFVASEFALVGARVTRVEELAAKGNSGAKMAANAIRVLKGD